jgi:hypothetical protein
MTQHASLPNGMKIFKSRMEIKILILIVKGLKLALGVA